MLREGGQGPGDVVPFMLPRTRLEVENACSQKGVDDGLLQGGDDVRVDGGIYEPVFDSIETVSKDIVVPCYAHITHDGGWGLICRLSW